MLIVYNSNEEYPFVKFDGNRYLQNTAETFNIDYSS